MAKLKKGKCSVGSGLAPGHHKEVEKGIVLTLPKKLDLIIAKAAIKRYYA
jgi:hypothetical protein